LKTDKFVPLSWKTFQGKIVTPHEIDQQHLSNVYWYTLIFCETVSEWVIGILAERFNGQLLEYRPHVDFTEEILALRDRGMINEITLTPWIHDQQIVYKGEVIGRINSMPKSTEP
jgi:hypothetical protein